MNGANQYSESLGKGLSNLSYPPGPDLCYFLAEPCSQMTPHDTMAEFKREYKAEACALG